MTHHHTIIRALLCGCALLLLSLAPADKAVAETCWGLICDGSVCCSGHGTCTAFNQCTCKPGYIGRECSQYNFCGEGNCSPNCSGNGWCASVRSLASTASYSGTCVGTSQSLTCTARTDGISASCLETADYPFSIACTLNGESGWCYYLGGGSKKNYECIWSKLLVAPDYGKNGNCTCKPGYIGSCCQILASVIDFGAQPVGSVSPVRSVTFANPLAAEAVTITAIALTGANPGDFVLGGTCTVGGSVVAAGSCDVTVAFAPTVLGSRNATLTLSAASAAIPATATAAAIPAIPTSVTSSLTGSGIIATDSIVIDTANPGTLYAGLDGGGIYKSIDNGANWTAATNQPTNTRVKALVIDKTDSTKLYAATYGNGVFKSVNSGVDWSACTNTALTNLNLLSLVIDGSGKLYAGTEAGVFVSADGCGSWTAMNGGMP